MQSVKIFWSVRKYFSTDSFCLFPVPAFYRLRRLINRRHAVRLLSLLFIDSSSLVSYPNNPIGILTIVFSVTLQPCSLLAISEQLTVPMACVAPQPAYIFCYSNLPDKR